MNVAIYARVSTQRQAQSQSIDQQLDRLRTHCRDQGWTLSQDAIFRDDGYSGASLNRPGLDQLRDRIKSGDIERVLITAPDRLGRKYAHQAIIIDEFERLGCQLEFLDRPMGQDPHDQLPLQIRGAVAEYSEPSLRNACGGDVKRACAPGRCCPVRGCRTAIVATWNDPAIRMGSPWIQPRRRLWRNSSPCILKDER